MRRDGAHASAHTSRKGINLILAVRRPFLGRKTFVRLHCSTDQPLSLYLYGPSDRPAAFPRRNFARSFDSMPSARQPSVCQNRSEPDFCQASTVGLSAVSDGRFSVLPRSLAVARPPAVGASEAVRTGFSQTSPVLNKKQRITKVFKNEISRPNPAPKIS